MKYLVHLSFPHYIYHSLILLNYAQALINKEEEVNILICNGGVNICYANIMGNNKMCYFCKKMQKYWTNLLYPKAKVFNYNDFLSQDIIRNNKNIFFKYTSISEIKDLNYKNVQIGFGAYSTYVSKTRNIDPKIDKSFKVFFDNLLRTECLVTDILESCIKKIHPDTIVSLNARHFEVKPFFDYPTYKGISAICLESGKSVVNDVFMGFDYGNNRPHNLKYINKLIENFWEQSKLSEIDKINLGKEFFIKKRNHITTGGIVFTENQKKGLLPKNWDNNKRNFVIFNSSEDEFVAIDSGWDDLALFGYQLTGIHEIAKYLSTVENTWLYVRVHPNLKGVDYNYHYGIYELEKEFKNITVIPAWDDVSSYSLLDHAEKIIVFGSTIGAEAVFWGKPVILLAGAYYYYLDICYTPQNIFQLIKYLNSVLVPKRNINAIKLGFYYMSQKGFELNKIKLERTNRFPFKPLKINRESYFGLIKRFALLNFLNKYEKKESKKIPLSEKFFE